MIPYEIISTGSKGNAVVLDGSLLIDCGVPFKRVEGYSKGLKLALLTHSHGDHLNPSTVRRLAKERPLLRFACGSWLVPRLLDAGVSDRQIDVLECGKRYDYGFCKVSSFDLVHDAQNCGWKIWMEWQKIFYATDTANLNGITAPGYDLYFLEANYVDAEMQERISEKKAAGEFAYERRAMRNHLSKQAADNWLYANMDKHSIYIYMHCHENKSEAEAG